MAFLHALEGLLTIMIMVSLGYLLTARGWFNPENAKLLPRLVNYVALPTYMLWNLTTTFEKEQLLQLFYGTAVPAISMITSYIIGWTVARVLNIASTRRGVFRASFFCSSSIFVGLPVNLALFGETSIPYVLLYFLVNAFLFWTIGNYSISLDGKAAPPKIISVETLKKVFSPPFTGFVVATILILLNVHLPGFVISTTKYLGSMTTPLSMLFIGITMFGVNLRQIKLDKDVLAVLLGRFIVSPVMVLVVCAFIPIPDLMKKVFVILAALPVMTQGPILAKVYEADTEYAAVLVTITTITAILVIPFYMAII